MGDLSKHFSRSEFTCKCNSCGFNTVDTKMLEVLENVREHFDKPVTITSGCRCVSHNRKIGGSKNSQHLIGRASDFKVLDIEPEEVYNYIDEEYPHTFGLGLYSGWVHLDSRQRKTRWRG
jgi:uncharacterized protein YcbK (DUF882 family)